MKYSLLLFLSFSVFAQTQTGPGITNDTRERGPVSGYGHGPDTPALPATDAPQLLQRQDEDLSKQGPSGAEAREAVKKKQLDLSDKEIKQKQTGD